MSPLLKKEIRLLLPGFLAGIVLTLSNLLLPDFGNSSPFREVWAAFPFLCCPAMAVMMALNSFGSEISFGTFSNVLAQPVSRHRVWRVKILLLAGALFILGSLWCLFFYLRYSPFKLPNNPQNFGDVVVCAWMFLLVVFAGSLWTVLLLRQVAAAFWFTLLVPGMILVLTSSLTAGLSEAVAEILLVTLLGIYALSGFWFARWLFFRAQDTQWTGGTIAMPEMHGLSNRFAKSGTVRRCRPRGALWRKELQLHQSQLIIAAGLALLHVGVIATRELGHFPRNSITEFILEDFWLLWMVMPLLVGCAAVAEERKMATLDGQLCLPVKRWTQFRIKFLVALLISVALGAVMPWLLEGGRILPGIKLHEVVNGIVGEDRFSRLDNFAFYAVNKVGVPGLAGLCLLSALFCALQPFGPFLLAAAGCAIISAIAFYGSSLARNTLQGLAPSVLCLLLMCFLYFAAARPVDFGLGFLWRGPLFYLIFIPVTIAVLAALAYGNCQRMRITGKVWLKNLLTLVIALGLASAATSAIYHRAWELLSSIEPPHGPARWTIDHPPRMQINGQTITVYLPDGRVWMNRFESETKLFGSRIIEDRMFGGGKFLAGTNWTEVRDCLRDIVGVQHDGSLWVSKKPYQFHGRSSNVEEKIASQVTELERFGDRRDWKSVSGRFVNPYLLKNDGTLWSWGTNRWKWNKPWPGLHAFTPQRLGTDSDWEGVSNEDDRTFLFKTNGEIWVEPPFENLEETKTLSPSPISIGRAPYLENRQWTEVASFFYDGLTILVGVFEDGTFREVAIYEWLPTPEKRQKTTGPHSVNHGSFAYVQQDLQIGQETNWLGLADYHQFSVTLKADGTLWKWGFITPRGFPRLYIGDFSRIYPVRFSSHSGWVAVGRMMDGIVSLAADGSLYLWRFQPELDYSYASSGMESSWLQVSRRPLFLGNVITQSN